MVELVFVEEDTRFENEALSDHPSKSDTSERVPSTIGYGTSTHIYINEEIS